MRAFLLLCIPSGDPGKEGGPLAGGGGVASSIFGEVERGGGVSSTMIHK